MKYRTTFFELPLTAWRILRVSGFGSNACTRPAGPTRRASRYVNTSFRRRRRRARATRARARARDARARARARARVRACAMMSPALHQSVEERQGRLPAPSLQDAEHVKHFGEASAGRSPQ